MTRDDIISIAREAGMTLRGHYDESGSTPQELERFAELLEAKVRKECAELCRAKANVRSPLSFHALHECADLIMEGYEE